MDSLSNLTASVRDFADARDWDQFHSPKNLACSISIEAGELLEQFQWRSEEEPPGDMEETRRTRIAEEMADVLIYLVRLSDKMGIDLIPAANRKLARNAEKYPVDKARGSNKKYTEL
jgi:dCTP diphosphatase